MKITTDNDLIEIAMGLRTGKLGKIDAAKKLEAIAIQLPRETVARITIRNPHKRKDIEMEICGERVTLERDCSMDMELTDISGGRSR